MGQKRLKQRIPGEKDPELGKRGKEIEMVLEMSSLLVRG